MRPLRLLFTIVFFPLLSAAAVFADPRQEIIDNTLTQTETSRASINTTPLYSYSDKTLEPEIPLRQASKTNFKSSGMSSEKKKAVEAALYLAAGYDVNHIHYSEWSCGNKLDEDFGNQDGFYINMGYKSPRYSETIKSKPFIEGYYRQYGDTIQYKGAASNGVLTWPYNVKQKSAIRRFGLKFGGYRDISKDGEFFAYLDVGKRTWIRGENEVIDGVLNYKEIYEWIYGGFGLGFTYNIHPKLSLGLEWEGWRAGSPKMYAELYEGGTFRLKDVSGMDLKMPIKYYLLKNLSFDLTPYFSYFNIGHSNTVILSGSPYYEPDSKTHEEGILLGFTYTL